MSKKYFITGIGTEVGKTVASAAIVQSLEADYWKPIQSGDLDYSDSIKVKQWISNPKTIIHPERHRLQYAASPHLSSAMEDIKIQLSDFTLPQTHNHLIVEGAGGIFVPINQRETILDLIKQLDLETIIVSRNYLGSINHTILTIETLKQEGVSIRGVLFNGPTNESSEKFITEYCQIEVLGRLPELEEINAKSIATASKLIQI